MMLLCSIGNVSVKADAVYRAVLTEICIMDIGNCIVVKNCNKQFQLLLI